jgi:hypothetical protein
LISQHDEQLNRLAESLSRAYDRVLHLPKFHDILRRSREQCEAEGNNLWGITGAFKESDYPKLVAQQRFYTVVSGIEFVTGGLSHDESSRRRSWLHEKRMVRLHLSKKASETFWNLCLTHDPRGKVADRLTAAITLTEGRFALATRCVFSVEDAAGNSRARERVESGKKNLRASETRHTLRASMMFRSADHWLTPAAIACRLCEPVRKNAKHIRSRLWDRNAPTSLFSVTRYHRI